MPTLEEAIKQEAERNRANGRTEGIRQAQKQIIAVCTPTLGAVSMWWHTCMVDLLWPTNMSKSFLPARDLKGNEIGQMRNRLVHSAFLFEKHNDVKIHSLMWIDDDVLVHRFAMLQLARHDVDIAAGVYFTKCDVAEPLIFEGGSSGCANFKPDTVEEHWGYAQGLSLVKMDVYRRMEEELELPKDEYGATQFYKSPEFGVDQKTGALILGGTEDFIFFDNASKMGIRPIVDSTKFAFGWHFDLAHQQGYPRQQWDQWVRREPVVWPARGDIQEVVWD